MSAYSNSSHRISPESLKVAPASHPGWKTAAEQPVKVGTEVYCNEGMARVTRILGKTQNGSRLLELRLIEGRQDPFFAAASNVLVSPE